MPTQRRNQKAVLQRSSSSESQTEGSKSQSTIWGDQARATSTHVFFWSGHLSNWHQGPQFSGTRALALFVPELTSRNLPHPPLDSFSTRLIQDHNYNCGEQWMMVVKAWLFEIDLELGRQVVATPNSAGDNTSIESSRTTPNLTDHQYQSLRPAMYATTPDPSWPATSRERQMYESSTCRILRAKKPGEQKALGRTVEGFEEKMWSDVNVACVVAACIARAEVDPVLRRMYCESRDLKFVEGSPKDTIWGVGLHWKSQLIEDEALWAGENRLGICHDRAAARVREMYGQREGEEG